MDKIDKLTPEQRAAAKRQQHAARPGKERERKRREYHANPRAKILSILQSRKHRERDNGICEICGKFSKLCWDHDHVIGHFRGWICGHCNSALGFVNDNIEILEALIAYLKRNGH
jgi:hypothetical protein